MRLVTILYCSLKFAMQKEKVTFFKKLNICQVNGIFYPFFTSVILTLISAFCLFYVFEKKLEFDVQQIQENSVRIFENLIIKKFDNYYFKSTKSDTDCTNNFLKTNAWEIKKCVDGQLYILFLNELRERLDAVIPDFFIYKLFWNDSLLAHSLRSNDSNFKSYKYEYFGGTIIFDITIDQESSYFVNLIDHRDNAFFSYIMVFGCLWFLLSVFFKQVYENTINKYKRLFYKYNSELERRKKFESYQTVRDKIENQFVNYLQSIYIQNLSLMDIEENNINQIPFIVYEEKDVKIFVKEICEDISDYFAFNFDNITFNFDTKIKQIELLTGKLTLYQVLFSLVRVILNILQMQGKVPKKVEIYFDVNEIIIKFNGFPLTIQQIEKVCCKQELFFLNYKNLKESLQSHSIKNEFWVKKDWNYFVLKWTIPQYKNKVINFKNYIK